MKSRDWIAAGVVALLAAPLLFLFGRAAADGEVRRRETPLRVMIGDEAYEQLARGDTPDQHYFGNDRRAPDFELRDREGRPWRLSEQRGKTVVMNFWTVTCRPCIEEMPTLIELDEILRNRRDVEVVTVTTDANWSRVAPFLPPDTHLRVLFDPDRAVVRGKFGTRLYPETWVIDPRGIIRLRVDGPRDWSNALALELIDSFR